MGRAPRPKLLQKLKPGALAPEQQFVLHLTEGQLQVLERALDAYSRIGMGQLKDAVYIMLRGRLDLPTDVHLKTEASLHEAIAGAGVPGGVQSISSPSISDQFRIAYDLQQVVRYGLHSYRFYRDPDYRQNCNAYVCSDPPRRYSTYEPNLPVLILRPLQRK